jgi:hypothetical protein
MAPQRVVFSQVAFDNNAPKTTHSLREISVLTLQHCRHLAVLMILFTLGRIRNRNVSTPPGDRGYQKGQLQQPPPQCHRRRRKHTAPPLGTATASSSLSQSPSWQVRGCRPPTCSAKHRSQPRDPASNPAAPSSERPPLCHQSAWVDDTFKAMLGTTATTRYCHHTQVPLDPAGNYGRATDAHDVWCFSMLQELTTVFETRAVPQGTNCADASTRQATDIPRYPTRLWQNPPQTRARSARVQSVPTLAGSPQELPVSAYRALT